MPVASIIIPTHKFHPYLYTAIESALSQTINDLEVIVVNDGAGPELTNQLRVSFPAIRIIDLHKNRGVSVARNIAAANAQSEFIAFLDSDDIAESHRIEKHLAYAKSHPETTANHCGSVIFTHEGIKAEHINKPDVLAPSDVLIQSHVPPSCLFIKRSVFLHYQGFAEHMRVAEDADLIVRMVSKGEKIGFIPEPLLRFRRMDHGNASTNGLGILKGKTQLLLRNYKFLVKHGGSLHPLRFMSYWLQTGGYRTPGILGKALVFSGKLMGTLTGAKY
jgi:glycosyltransferase involved in cell wall biosynthesis